MAERGDHEGAEAEFRDVLAALASPVASMWLHQVTRNPGSAREQVNVYDFIDKKLGKVAGVVE